MKNKIYTGMLLGCFLLCGCSDWLDVKPYDKISDDELFSTEEGFQKLLNGVYVELNNDKLYGCALTVEMIEIMGGAYTIGTDNSVWGNYKDLADYQYETEYWRGRLSETWNEAYAMILNCMRFLRIWRAGHLFLPVIIIILYAEKHLPCGLCYILTCFDCLARCIHAIKIS